MPKGNTFAGAKVAPSSAGRKGAAKSSFATGSPPAPKGMGGLGSPSNRVIKTGPYPDAARSSGGMAKGNATGGKPSAHPMRGAKKA